MIISDIQNVAKVDLQMFVWKIQLINNNTSINSVFHRPTFAPPCVMPIMCKGLSKCIICTTYSSNCV